MSFYTALTGLNAASKELSVTANNIANSSTTGFKKSSVSFGDIFASSPLQNRRTAVGQGVAIKGVDQQFTQGFIEFSSNALDLAITGDGFFPLETADGASIYTRNGIFMLNDQNQVVNSAGQSLMSIPVDSLGRADFSRSMQTLTIPPKTSGTAVATENVAINFNLPANAPVPGPFDINDPDTFNASTAVNVYDSNGNERTLSLYYRNDGANWKVHAYLDGELITDAIQNANPADLVFDGAGNVISNTIDLGFSLGGGNLTLDLSASTQIGNEFGFTSQTVDGTGEGELLGIDINDQGLVSASYSNGTQLALGKVALVNFDVPAGLRQLGDSSFVATVDSGNAKIGEAGGSGFGTIRAGALERSNVDLTEELVSMINSQRKFQANAKAIETSSTLAQTIINLRS